MSQYLILLFLFFTIFDLKASENPLSLESYLSQIKLKNDDYKSRDLSIKSSQDKSLYEPELLTLPNAFAEYMKQKDKAPKNNSNMALVDSIESDIFKIGVEKQTNWGLSGRMGYNYTHSKINPSLYPASQSLYNENSMGSPFIELTFPLRRNFLGHETSSTKKALEKKYEAEQLGKSFENKALLAESEGVFWQLLISRELIKVQKEALSRYEKIRDWNASKVKKGLADKSDLLQAESAYNYKSYEVKNSIDDEKKVARKFNSLRGLESEEVTESLSPLKNDDLNYNIPNNMPNLEREDIKAAIALYQASLAQSELSKQKITSSLDIVSSYSLNSMEKSSSKALSNSFKKDHPVWAIGLSFKTPLGPETINPLDAAYEGEKIASELALKRKEFELHRNWKDLKEALEDAKSRLHLAKILEEGQLKTLNHEKQLLYLGRTTTFQVLHAEIEYANSQQLRLKEEGIILGLLSEMKLYF